MTWFSLPPARSETPPPFVDRAGCERWLATQPLTDAARMQGELADRLADLNAWPIAPPERYRIVEALRRSSLAVDAESAKRYVHRPLPLSPAERKTLDASCRLWRETATAYLHCLRACLDGEPAPAVDAAKVCHRAISALRREQLARHRGGAAVPGAWWRCLHAVFAAAEQLGVAATPVADRLLAETRESTVRGHYAMAVLLHLARPAELSRGEFAAVVRWLARWREQAVVHAAPPPDDERCVAVDLAADAPLHRGEGAPSMPRWIALDAVLGKIRRRARSLQAGASPEELRLGSDLPAEACVALLQALHGRLQQPPLPLPAAREDARTVDVAGGVERAYRLLGGGGLAGGVLPSSVSARREHEQIAIFGHVVRPAAGGAVAVPTEPWQALAEDAGEPVLRRPPGEAGEVRLSCRSLVAVRDADGCRLAVVRSLATQEDGSLVAVLRPLAGRALPLLAAGEEKGSRRALDLPAIFLPPVPDAGTPASVLVPGGLLARLARLEIAGLPDGLRLGEAIERGADFERLRCE